MLLWLFYLKKSFTSEAECVIILSIKERWIKTMTLRNYASLDKAARRLSKKEKQELEILLDKMVPD